MSMEPPTSCDSWIIIDKPKGMTSFEVIRHVRKKLNVKKVGHAGTLDPLATGVLPVAVGRATTKTISLVMDSQKTYDFTVKWGEERATDDAEGEVVATSTSRPDQKEIAEILPSFHGSVLQLPPLFSALKIRGKRACDRVRRGEAVELSPRLIDITSLVFVSATAETASFRAICGKGTYIRSLARDMGRLLGCYGYIQDLRRIQAGPFTLEQSLSMEEFLNKF